MQSGETSICEKVDLCKGYVLYDAVGYDDIFNFIGSINNIDNEKNILAFFKNPGEIGFELLTNLSAPVSLGGKDPQHFWEIGYPGSNTEDNLFFLMLTRGPMEMNRNEILEQAI